MPDYDYDEFDHQYDEESENSMDDTNENNAAEEDMNW